jgi:hypothetical protein
MIIDTAAQLWYNGIAGAEDRAMLESDPSADAGDGATGQNHTGSAPLHMQNCTVWKAINPCLAP